MLSLYYIAATFWQSWRIKSVCQKMTEQLAQQVSVAFYTLPAATEDGYDIAYATSELCTNRSGSKVCELLWLHGIQRGCCLRPIQTLNITPWISFTDAPSLLPFAYAKSPEMFIERLSVKKGDDVLYLLLETEVQPNYKNGRHADVVRLENYGKLIAWKIDSHLAILIITDIEHFTRLLVSTFLQNRLLINDHLPLLRIESVNHEGKPQPFDMLASHLRKPTRTAEKLQDDEWHKHLDGLRALSVLANQATEFEYKKNRTEGKTGVVKPDLIPHEKKATATEASTSESATLTVSTTASAASTTTTPAKTVDINSTQDPTKETTTMPTKLATTSVFTQPTSSPTTSLTNPKAKPTEIEKHATIVTDGRFKTSKVCESSDETASTQTTTAVLNKTNIEPLAPLAQIKANEPQNTAATAVNQPQKAPSETFNSSANTAFNKEHNSLPESKETNGNPEETITSKGSISVSRDNAKRPSLKRNKDSLRENKPLNILVYSDSASARDSALVTLRDIVEDDTYTIYPMTPQQVQDKHWLDNTALLVVCGAVAANTGEILLNYFLRGGRVLSICSDILHFILPNYHTAEVREHELVQFSYAKWQKVKMMHHIFCYQPSPVRKNFSTDSDDAVQLNANKPALVCPRSIELKDLHGELHNLEVEVLGTEETWNTPSLLLAHSKKSGGKAVFSQVHLETHPSQFEADESKYSILKKNERIRLEIFGDLLSNHLDVSVRSTACDAEPSTRCVYQNAYFLGRHESKFELLEKLKQQTGANQLITTSKLALHFCGKDDKPATANVNVLPILIHSCPDDFSTVDYFDNLKTAHIGRLVIYAPVVSSSMYVIKELELTHGLVVLVRQQTRGLGRKNNQWLSPLGCAMFSIQLHIPLKSPLGERLPLIQHIVGVAIVNALKSHAIYGVLDIGLKWPNDIYANSVNKLGGLIIETSVEGDNAIINIGCGVNLDNSKPTICINDLISAYNHANKQNLPPLKYEMFVALMFNEIERLLDKVQKDDFEEFYDLYYALWLHNDQAVSISDKKGKKTDAQVISIDELGYLRVRLCTGVMETVQPDGNSFDMLKGLIIPKFN